MKPKGNFLVVFPAYGRVYQNDAQLRDSFMNGADFSPFRTGGSYLSIRDFQDDEVALRDYDGVVLTQPRAAMYLEVAVSREDMRKHVEAQQAAERG